MRLLMILQQVILSWAGLEGLVTILGCRVK